MHQHLYSASNNSHLAALSRAAFFVAMACGVTLGLFWVMSALVENNQIPPAEQTPTVIINPLLDENLDKPIVEKSLPEPPKVMEPPKSMPPSAEDISSSDMSFSDQFAFAAPEIGGDIDTSFSMESGGDARPIVRIEPRYPIQAARDGIEGWVRLSFDINETGGVENVKVIEAEPKRVFNREAQRALRKWKYKPKMENGKATQQVGLTVELSFKLSEES